MDYPCELKRKMNSDAWSRDLGWAPLADILDMAQQLPEPAGTRWDPLPTMDELLAAVTQKTDDGTQYGIFKGVAFKLTPA